MSTATTERSKRAFEQTVSEPWNEPGANMLRMFAPGSFHGSLEHS